jgi:hypothetical protein
MYYCQEMEYEKNFSNLQVESIVNERSARKRLTKL